ncbi:MAG: hypothetical protein LCH56_05900 [Proteobacteria bacterium]|nr:hypothetical protein [Pseudomonadota bacterium]
MATVARLVEILAIFLGIAPKTVNVYARALLNAGLLPLSRGRRIEEVEPIHIVRLLLALALQPKVKDAAQVVDAHGKMRPGGITPAMIKSNPRLAEAPTAESALAEALVMLTGSKRDEQSIMSESIIEIVSSWPEISISHPKLGVLYRFTAPGNTGDLWQAHIKQAATIHGGTLKLLAGAMFSDAPATTPETPSGVRKSAPRTYSKQKRK